MGIHILILAEAELGGFGGGESVILGLVRGLAAIDRGDDRVSILCTPSLGRQLQALMVPGMQVINRPRARPSAGGVLRQILGPLRTPLGRIVRRLAGSQDQGLPSVLPPIDEFVRSLRADVIHFLVPFYASTDGLPSVFTLYDLQHEHLPEIFTESMIRYRRMLNDAVVKECSEVAAISEFAADDFKKHHACQPEKLTVIPLAAYVSSDEPLPVPDAEDAVRLDALPADFILYPAFSYEHKNHIGLLNALSLLERKHNLRLPLVCTGGRSDYWQRVRRHQRALVPSPLMLDLRYVSRPMLRAVYQKARFVVFPSLFEGAGLPLLEAASLKVPIACSDIPPFREFGGDGPAFLNPSSAESICSVIKEFWLDEEARRVSAGLTAAHCSGLSWERCAHSYLQLYRRAFQCTPQQTS